MVPEEGTPAARPVPIEAEPFPSIPVRGRNHVERSRACGVRIADGLTPHLLRHTHKTWLNEDRIDLKLAHERLGHEMGGVGARYSHVTDGMRDELLDALTARWESAVDARLEMSDGSPVAVLDELMKARRDKKIGGANAADSMIVSQDSHSGAVVGLRASPRKRA